MLHNIPDELSFKDRNLAYLFFIMKGYKTEYKFKDKKNGLWIMEGYDFFTRKTGMSESTVRRKLKEMEKLNQIVLVFPPL